MSVILFVLAAVGGIYVMNYFRQSRLVPTDRAQEISIDINKIRSIDPDSIAISRPKTTLTASQIQVSVVEVNR